MIFAGTPCALVSSDNGWLAVLRCILKRCARRTVNTLALTFSGSKKSRLVHQESKPGASLRITYPHDYHISNYDARETKALLPCVLSLYSFLWRYTPSPTLDWRAIIRKRGGSGTALRRMNPAAPLRLMLWFKNRPARTAGPGKRTTPSGKV